MHHGKTYLLCVFVAASGLAVTWKVCRPVAGEDQTAHHADVAGSTKGATNPDTPQHRAFVLSNDSAADALLSHPIALPASLGMLAPNKELLRQEGHPTKPTGEPLL